MPPVIPLPESEAEFLRVLRDEALASVDLRGGTAGGGLSQGDLEQRTGMSRPSVVNLIKHLRPVLRDLPGESTRATRVGLDPEAGIVFGVNIGHSVVQVATADLFGQLETPHERRETLGDADTILDWIVATMEGCLAQLGRSPDGCRGRRHLHGRPGRSSPRRAGLRRDRRRPRDRRRLRLAPAQPARPPAQPARLDPGSVPARQRRQHRRARRARVGRGPRGAQRRSASSGRAASARGSSSTVSSIAGPESRASSGTRSSRRAARSVRAAATLAASTWSPARTRWWSASRAPSTSSPRSRWRAAATPGHPRSSPRGRSEPPTRWER